MGGKEEREKLHSPVRMISGYMDHFLVLLLLVHQEAPANKERTNRSINRQTDKINPYNLQTMAIQVVQGLHEAPVALGDRDLPIQYKQTNSRSQLKYSIICLPSVPSFQAHQVFLVVLSNPKYIAQNYSHSLWARTRIL